jgi:phage gp29-like protein
MPIIMDLGQLLADQDPSKQPANGQMVLPHVATFAGMATSLAKVYRIADEALLHSRENARAMRNDLSIMECVEARQRAVALLSWHIEHDPSDPVQRALAADVTRCLEAIPRFTAYRENLLHAVFYGRYAVAQRWRWRYVHSRLRLVVDAWRPVHGDKIVYRVPEDAEDEADAEAWQIGILVGAAYKAGDMVAGRWKVEATDRGLAYFLEPWERPLLAVHTHSIEDGEFEVPYSADRLHGVGLRSRIYATWYQKQETLAWLMEYMERSALGFEIWYYPWGNPAARAAVVKAAEERRANINQILVPKIMEGDSFTPTYDRIEPSMAGAEALKTIITEYFGHLIKRYIMGQTLTSEAGSTGLGSNLADIHLATFLQIVRYDAVNLEETITTDLVRPLLAFNFRRTDLPLRFKIDTESEDAAERLDAIERAAKLGLRIRSEDVYRIVGITKPTTNDEVLSAAAAQPAAAGAEIPPDQPPGSGPPEWGGA